MITPLVQSFLYDEVPTLEKTLRFIELDKRTRYKDGTQYQDRAFDAEGYRKGSPGVYGFGSRTTPWCERDIGVHWEVRGEITNELTNWSMAGAAWCNLTVPDDKEAQDWLVTVTTLAGFGDVVRQSREFGGGIGALVVSYMVRGGRFIFEAHNPRDCYVLEWRDEALHRPAIVAKVYRGENIFAKTKDDLPMLCRVWDETDETVYRRHRDELEGGWVWRVHDSQPHGLGRCPLHWCPNGDAGGAHDGLPDAPGAEERIDAINELMCAGEATTKRNADDTLVIDPIPGTDTNGRIRKGGHNAIMAKSATYLGQDGDSARICLEIAEKAAARIQRRAGVTMADPKDMGQNTSGETLKRLFQRTINTAWKIRGDVERGLIVPMARDILDVSRILGIAAFDVPPGVSEDEIGGQPVTVVTPRTPGKSRAVQVVWPTPFPPTLQDQAAAASTVSTATGAKATLSLPTAVAYLAAAGFPIPNVLAELARIKEDEDAAAERQEKAMGLGAPPAGEAGPTEDEEPQEGEKKDEAAA